MAALVLLGGWLLLRETPAPWSEAMEVAEAPIEAEGPGARPRSPAAAEPESTTKPGPSPEALRARREMRQRIVDALAAREHAAERDRAASGDGTGSTGERPEPAATGAEEPPPRRDSEPHGGGLVDRTGTREYLVDVMNEDLMPLADECIELARHGEPELAGMLVLDFEIITDEEIGGVVESVAPGQDNEVPNLELMECMRESILATTLPPPDRGGRDAISISLRLSPDQE